MLCVMHFYVLFVHRNEKSCFPMHFLRRLNIVVMGHVVWHAFLRAFRAPQRKIMLFHAFLRRLKIVVMGYAVWHAFLRAFCAPQ